MDFPLRASPAPPNPAPVAFGAVRNPGNPVITVNATEPHEQYTPAPVQMLNGDVWIYVKGHNSIYAWKSTDGGITFAIQNAGNPVVVPGAGGTWDESFTVEPVAVYDSTNNLIHLYYGGRAAAGDTTWAWGHATAPDSTPTVFTKDAANPILTSGQVSTSLGGGAMGDLKISDVLMIGGTFHFYGYCLYAGTYRLIHATGSAWNNPSGTAIIASAPATWQTVIERATVAALPNGRYVMLYAIGGDQLIGLFGLPRKLRPGSSPDGATWDLNGSDVICPYGPPAPGWEIIEAFSGAFLKQNVAPFAAPILDANGRWRYYYSGLAASAAKAAQVGLATLDPV